MLGAQARAAELAAASAAKQRQVSRELEERQLPPNPAVSLSAFTKPQPTTSRNKGNKNWKPLVLDDLIETSDDAATSDPPISTPGNADRLTAKEASDKKIPTAPRAMVAGRSLSTIVAHSQPPMQPSPVVNMPSRPTNQAHGRLYPGGFSYLVSIQNMYSHRPMFLGGIPMQDAPHFETFGSMMVPDDISPTKQEQKFSMLENIPFPPSVQYHGHRHPSVAPHGMLQHDDLFSHGTHPNLVDDHQYRWEGSGHDTYYGYQIPFPAQPQNVAGDYGGVSDRPFTAHITQIPGHGPTPTTTHIEGAPDQRVVLPIRRVSNQQLSCESSLRNQEPYDTERAMKECVNKLKEKARDGKTVLHNPNTHKDPQQQHVKHSEMAIVETSIVRKPSSIPQAPVPWEVLPKDSNRTATQWPMMPLPADQNSEGQDFFNLNLDNAEDPGNIKPAPGLPFPRAFALPQLSLERAKIEAVNSSSAPEVGSLEWMCLAPITTVERERVRRLMALAAKSVTNEVPMSSTFHVQDKEDLSEAQRWFYTDARGEKLLREQVNLTARAHASKVIADIHAHGGEELPGHFKDGKDDGMAATLILGNVACNLQTYLVGDRKSIEQRRNFHRVRSVPDWCTERGGLTLGGLGGGDSYFDGAAGGFYGAPVRVARDPRFRPQMKEGMKVKPEEEWKNRHEMYGRRIM